MAKGQARPGGRGPQGRQERTRQKVAAQRAEQARRERQRRLLVSIGVIVVVVGVIAALVAIGLSKKSSNATRQPAPASLVAKVTGVPAATLNAVGAGPAHPPTHITNGTPLTSGGKPQVVYVGAEYCPHCGAERWALINALARFGTFTNLQTTRSATNDGDVPTFSFYGSSYSSPYLVFSPTELETDTRAPLQAASNLDKQLLSKYDIPPYVPSGSEGAIPFLDFGNHYVDNGVNFDDSAFLNTGLSWNQIAADMQSPSTGIGQSVDGSANMITASICSLTNGQPANVCTAPGVVAAKAKLPAS